MKNEILYEVDSSSNSEVTAFMKKKMTEWADSIDGHGIEDFGNEIVFKSIHFRPYYQMTVTTQYEGRKKLAKKQPYNGEDIEECTLPDYKKYDRWEMPMGKSGAYEDTSNTERVKGSSKVKDCDTCKTAGKITCPDCGGRGEETCGNCRGTGEVNCSRCAGSGEIKCRVCNGSGDHGYSTCGSCGGKGHVTVSGYSDTSQGWKQCARCGGSGRGQKRTCSACGGRGTQSCSYCSGSGKETCSVCGGTCKVTCSRCSGNREIICTSCKGTKRLLWHLEVLQQFKPGSDTSIVPNADVHPAFPDLPDLIWNEDPMDVFSEGAENSLPEALFEGFPVDRAYREARTALLEKGPLGETGSSVKVLRQYVDVKRCEVYDMQYEYEGKAYRIILYGPDGKFYALESPFMDMSNECFQKSKDLSESGDIGKSVAYLLTALRLDTQDLRKSEHSEFYEELLLKFRSSYKRNVILATLISLPFFSYLSLVFYRNPVFIFSFISSSYEGVRPFAHSIVMAALYTGLSLFSVKALYEKIHDVFNSRLRSPSFRRSFTILLTFSANLFIWAGLFLGSLSGATLLITEFLLGIGPVRSFFEGIMPAIIKILPGV